MSEQVLEPYLRQYIETRTVQAVLLVDVVESVRLVEQDETTFVARWLSFVDHVGTDILPAHRGRLVKSLGDGMLLVFPDSRDAVEAAFVIQAECDRRHADLPPDRRILLRMGIEAGEMLVSRDDVFGRDVNRAARLLTLAAPGGTPRKPCPGARATKGAGCRWGGGSACSLRRPGA